MAAAMGAAVSAAAGAQAAAAAFPPGFGAPAPGFGIYLEVFHFEFLTIHFCAHRTLVEPRRRSSSRIWCPPWIWCSSSRLSWVLDIYEYPAHSKPTFSTCYLMHWLDTVGNAYSDSL